MKRLFPMLALMICFSLIISSCNLPLEGSSPASTAPVQDVVGTAAAQTVQAMSTQIVQTAQPQQMPPTFTLSPTVPTNTVEAVAPSDTPSPTPTNTPVPPTATIGLLDKLGKVEDVTFADGTLIHPGTTFTKTWRLTNAGNTTWGPGYAVVFSSGDSMNSPASVPITANVPPNGTMDISVPLTSPSTAKSYTGYYKLRNAGGALFGFGKNADQAFWVKITVGTPTTATSSVFAVTSVETTINKSSVNIFCPALPYTFKWTAKITANKAGTVTYHWARSDGSESSTKTLKFTEAGTHSVSDTWDITAPDSGWERIYIEDPNHQSFTKVTFKMTCK